MATLTTTPADLIRPGHTVTLPDGTTGHVVAVQRRIWRISLALCTSPTEGRIINLSTVDAVEVHT